MWVVDTCVLIDVLEADPQFGLASAELLEQLHPEGLTICPVTYAELAPAFDGSAALQEEFLFGVGVDFRHDWSFQDTARAHSAWHLYVQSRRRTKLPQRPLADVLIGAFATGRSGLVTRNRGDFADLFPELAIAEP
jgi:hypothetical protein